jgi:hypothetical protein
MHRLDARSLFPVPVFPLSWYLSDAKDHVAGSGSGCCYIGISIAHVALPVSVGKKSQQVCGDRFLRGRRCQRARGILSQML